MQNKKKQYFDVSSSNSNWLNTQNCKRYYQQIMPREARTMNIGETIKTARFVTN